MYYTVLCIKHINNENLCTPVLCVDLNVKGKKKKKGWGVGTYMVNSLCYKVQAAATSVLSMAQRRYPTSKVRGRSREDPMPEGQRPRGVTPRPWSGAAAKSAGL